MSVNVFRSKEESALADLLNFVTDGRVIVKLVVLKTGIREHTDFQQVLTLVF